MTRDLSPATLADALTALYRILSEVHRAGAEHEAQRFARAAEEIKAALSRSRQSWRPAPLPGEAGYASVVGVAEAARRLGVSPRTIQRRAADGRIPAQLIGGRWLIHMTTEDE